MPLMRLLFLCLFSLSLFIVSCSSDEQAPNISLGLNISQKEIDDVHEKFNLLQGEFEKIKSGRTIISDVEQTDVGFIYFDLLEGKVQTLDKLLVNVAGFSVEDIVVLYLMLVAKDAQQDLKDLLISMDSNNEKKKNLLEALSTWEVRLLDFQKELKDIALSADDVQQVVFTDTTVTEVNVPSSRAAFFIRNGQPGSVTQISITSKSGQTTPILFRLEDMATDDVLFSETTSKDLYYSNTFKKNAFMLISLKLANEGDVTIPITLRIIHTRKVVSKPKAIPLELGDIVRDLSETIQAELQKLNGELEDLYKSQFVSAAESKAVKSIVGLSVNHFNYSSDPFTNKPLIYKYLTKTNTESEMGEQVMEALKKWMNRKGNIENKIGASLKKISDTQSAITENIK